MKTVGGMTFDESKINIYAQGKDKLKKFFSKPEIQKLVDEDNWKEIFIEWPYSGKTLTKLLLLSEIDFLSYFTDIPIFIFYDCKFITSIKIPEGVKVIYREAFFRCDYLTSIVIPKSVTAIGCYVFYGCPSLKSITYLGTKAEWDNIDKSLEWTVRSSIEKIICKDGEIKLK